MRVPTVAVLTLAGLGLAVGGCASTEPGASGPTTGTTTGSAAPEPTVSGTASGCMVGTWRTTEVSGRAASAAASGSISGGSGATVTISPNGQVRADFSGMRPLSFTAEVGGNAVAGSATYGGQGTATIKATATNAGTTTAAPAAPATPPGPAAGPTATAAGPSATVTATATPPAPAAEEGTWEPVGAIDWSALRVTLELTEPLRARLLDNAPIGDYIDDAANQSGQAIETDPILGAGAYSCQGSTLTLKGDADNDGLTWTLTKI
ncbi:hypothetical protein [Phytohabitans suffuscus]|uniref:Lipoprotein n=1 Tax=Phytohabitans suffuscus TaxID=624315 RepID=A0A6F8YM92_9ACTN|nr:hypothetical protein [Phytohabitans suffuscus]BCB87187.1 hypothetical protein Psuf_045000 [Phytohabitans suffuscus]